MLSFLYIFKSQVQFSFNSVLKPVFNITNNPRRPFLLANVSGYFLIIDGALMAGPYVTSLLATTVAESDS